MSPKLSSLAIDDREDQMDAQMIQFEPQLYIVKPRQLPRTHVRSLHEKPSAEEVLSVRGTFTVSF